MSRPTLYGYDARGNRTSVTDANGHTTTFDYDLADRLVRETTPIGSVTEYGYDLGGNRVRKLDANGQRTLYVYDANERLTDIEYFDGTSAHYGYDARGERIFEQGADSTREMRYDALGRLIEVVDVESGRTIDYGYDASGNRTSMTVLPDGETTTHAYDARGLMTRMTDAEGGEYFFGHDAAGRRVVETQPNGTTRHTVYDAASRVLGLVYVDAARQLLDLFAYRYDARGNRTHKVLRDGTSEVYGYDALSRLVRASYPSGRAVEYSYDAVGNRVTMTEGTSGGGPEPCAGDSDCDGVLDADDNCPAIANASQLDSDRLPALNAVAAYRFEEGSGTTAQDSSGTSHGTLMNGATRLEGVFGGQALSLDGVDDHVRLPTTSALNVAGDITVEAWVNPGPSAGNPIQAIAHKEVQYSLARFPDGSVSWADSSVWDYATFGFYGDVPPSTWTHVAATKSGATVTLYINGEVVVQKVFGGALVGNGNAAHIGCYAGATTCVPGRHFQGKLDEVVIYNRVLSAEEVQQHAVHGITNDNLGDACDACPLSADPQCVPLTCLDADQDGYGPQGASTCSAGEPGRFDCDDADAAVHPGAVEACNLRDDDCDGQVDERCFVSAATTAYSYNAFNQLVSATGPSGTTTFAYDDNGNQTSKTEAGGVTTYTYDARDRLVEVTVGGATALRAGYDTQGLRVRVEDASGTRRVLLDGVEELAEYEAGSGARVARYDHDPSRIDALLGQVTAQGKVHAVTDALGSVYGLTDGGGEAVTRYGYDVYGQRSASQEAVATKWGFTGRVHETGIAGGMYYRAREYYSEFGRFDKVDPLGFVDGPNRYWYAGGNPVLLRDPTGLLVEVWCENIVTSPTTRHCYIRVACQGSWGCGSDPSYDKQLELWGPAPDTTTGRPHTADWDEDQPGGGTRLNPVRAEVGLRSFYFECGRENCIRNSYTFEVEHPRQYVTNYENSNSFVIRVLARCNTDAWLPGNAYGASIE